MWCLDPLGRALTQPCRIVGHFAYIRFDMFEFWLNKLNKTTLLTRLQSGLQSSCFCHTESCNQRSHLVQTLRSIHDFFGAIHQSCLAVQALRAIQSDCKRIVMFIYIYIYIIYMYIYFVLVYVYIYVTYIHIYIYIYIMIWYDMIWSDMIWYEKKKRVFLHRYQVSSKSWVSPVCSNAISVSGRGFGSCPGGGSVWGTRW